MSDIEKPTEEAPFEFEEDFDEEEEEALTARRRLNPLATTLL
jgi:hypothetical protein